MNKTLVAIVGPTAIGKTALSITLAQHFNTEIISADSRQFYKEMQIGTAVPSLDELQAVPHHFIQHKSVKDYYNVGDFENDAISCLNLLFKSHKVVIMVGGSGLYINAVTKGLDKLPKVDLKIRNQLYNELHKKGLKTLQEQLKILDLKAYNTIAIENPQRLIRALEVCLSSGNPYSSFLSHTEKKREFSTLTIGLTAEREIIYQRINQRVDIMMQNGLLNEVKHLLPYQHLNGLNTVGYKELFKYLDGTWDKEIAVSEIKKNTRRFAKRQGTWFRKNKDIKWFNFETPTKEIIEYLKHKLVE